MSLIVQGRAVRGGWVGRITVAGLARIAVVTGLALALATGVLAAVGHDVSAFLVPDTLGFPLMGFVLLSRRPNHPMGALFSLIGVVVGIDHLVFAYERYTLVHAPGALPFGTAVLWLNTWSYAPATSLAGPVLPLVFPDGRLLSRRWRPALWAALAFIPLAATGSAFVPQTMGAFFRDLPNPYASYSAARPFMMLLILALACGVFTGAAAAMSGLGIWYVSLGRNDRAARDHDEALSLIDPDVVRQSPRIGRGQLGTDDGDVTVVEFPYLRAARVAPVVPSSWADLPSRLQKLAAGLASHFSPIVTCPFSWRDSLYDPLYACRRGTSYAASYVASRMASITESSRPWRATSRPSGILAWASTNPMPVPSCVRTGIDF